MADLAINEDLDVYIDKRGDLAFATGRQAFEQKVMLHLTAEFYGIIGEGDPETIREQMRVRARRVAKQVDMLERLESTRIEKSDEKPNTMEVEIHYDTGEVLSFEVGG